jgi:uncharacterized protein (TIGR02444 family)
MDFPDHPFWDFSLALYAKPGVAESCLRLQDGLGLDVNLLLYACWTAAKGAGRPSPDGWRRLVDETAAWRAQVVEPLRRVRRFLKGAEESPWSAGLRDRVKALELDAEHAGQLSIATLAGTGGAAAAGALATMLDYIGVLDVALSDADRSDLSAIASQVAGNMAKM